MALHHHREAPKMNATIVVSQLDSEGNVYRTFKYFPRNLADITCKIDNIERAFNMDATRVEIVRGV